MKSLFRMDKREAYKFLSTLEKSGQIHKFILKNYPEYCIGNKAMVLTLLEDINETAKRSGRICNPTN